MKKISYLALASSIVLPFVASAQLNTTQIKDYSTGIISVINDYFVPTLIAIAFITFLWSIYKYFIKGGGEVKEREEGRMYMMWSIIGFVVILSVWALVTLLSGVAGLTPGSTNPKPPIFNSTAG